MSAPSTLMGSSKQDKAQLQIQVCSQSSARMPRWTGMSGSGGYAQNWPRSSHADGESKVPETLPLGIEFLHSQNYLEQETLSSLVFFT